MRIFLLTLAILPAIASALEPRAPTVEDRCETIELNAFYDENGRHVFDQIIFWQHGEIIAWRLWKENSPHPVRLWESGEFLLRWHDGETLREVRAKSFRETWTQHDEELRQRAILPQCERRELLTPRTTPSGAKPDDLPWND